MSKEVINVNGIVLREVDVGEYDKMLTVLTAELGKISVFARGAKRLKSPDFVACQVYAYSVLTVKTMHDKYYLCESGRSECFFGIRDSLEGAALAAYIADVACDIALEDQPEAELLRLVLNSLYSIAKKLKPPMQIKAAFELRAVSEAGFMPELVGWEGCGGADVDTYYFDVEGGYFCCENCYRAKETDFDTEARRASEAEGIYSHAHLIIPLSPSVFAAMRYVIYCRRERLFAFDLKDEAMEQFAGACEKYLLCHLERDFKTLDFYHSVAELRGG